MLSCGGFDRVNDHSGLCLRQSTAYSVVRLHFLLRPILWYMSMRIYSGKGCTGPLHLKNMWFFCYVPLIQPSANIYYYAPSHVTELIWSVTELYFILRSPWMYALVKSNSFWERMMKFYKTSVIQFQNFMEPVINYFNSKSYGTGDYSTNNQ